MTSHTSGRNCAGVWANFPEALTAIIARLQGVVIEQREATDVILRNDTPETLHYVDPPYVAETRDKGSDYRHEMTHDDHRRLAEVLNAVKGAVVLSGYPSVLYDELFGHWRRVERAAQADGARARTEVLWMRNVDHGLFGLINPEPVTSEISARR
jgi:DNA adenine methylase